MFDQSFILNIKFYFLKILSYEYSLFLMIIYVINMTEISKILMVREHYNLTVIRKLIAQI